MTLRDKLEQRRAALFTDRELELKDMERLLATSPLAYNFLHISGVGGIGKSALVQAFARRCRVRGLPVALIDARAPRTAIEILAALQDQLRDWDAFTKFEQELRKYLSIQGKLEKSSDVPERIVQLATKGITLVSQLHPLSHFAVQMVGPESIEAALELLHKVLTKDEIEFYLDAEDTLTQAFTSSLEKLTDRERMVLIFDSFERIGDLSAWLAGSVASHLPERVLVILAGRDPLGPEWDRWRPLTREMPISPFSPASIEVYLRRRGIHNNGLIEDIATFTRGLPLGLATCADLNERWGGLVTDGLPTNDRITATDLLIHRIIGPKTQRNLRAALEACAVLRTFDEDALAFMLQRAETADLYQELRELSFVQTYEGRAGLHDVVRDMLREQFRHYAPDRFVKANHRAAEFYTQRISRRQPGRWEIYLIEKLYHLLTAAPDEGFGFFVKVYSEAERMYRLNLCAALLAETKQGPLSPEQARWIKFYEGKLLFLYNHWKKAQAIYEQLANEDITDLSFRAAVLVEWGRAAAQLGQWAIAVGRYQQALAIWRNTGEVAGEAQTLLNLSNAYRLQGNWKAAQSAAEASLALWENLGRRHEAAYALNLLGDIHRVQGHWIDAKSLYTACLGYRRALNDQHGVGQTLRNLGDVYRLQARWSEATKCYRESLAIQRKVNDDYEIARLLHSLGAVALLRNNPREALRNFSYSMKIRRSLGDRYRVARTLRSMADAYTALGDYDLAITSLKEARQLLDALGDEFGVGLTDDSLGMAWRAKGDAVQAQIAFESSLAIMRRNDNRYYEARVLAHLCELGEQTQNDDLVLRYEPDVAVLSGTTGIDNWLTTAYGILTRVYLRLDDTERAAEYQRKADEAQQWSDATRARRPPGDDRAIVQ